MFSEKIICLETISRPFSLSSYRVIPNNMSSSLYRFENRMWVRNHDRSKSVSHRLQNLSAAVYKIWLPPGTESVSSRVRNLSPAVYGICFPPCTDLKTKSEWENMFAPWYIFGNITWVRNYVHSIQTHVCKHLAQWGNIWWWYLDPHFGF